MISISTNNLISSVKAEIDGNVFTVRKIGAGDQLDMSQIITDMQKDKQELLNLSGKEKSGADVTEERLKAINKFGKHYTALEEAYAKLFDDSESKEKSIDLVRRIGVDNMAKVLKQIFGE